MRVAVLVLVVASLWVPSQAAHAEDALIVRAAPLRGDAEWPPRRLFNAGLEAEQQGNKTRAVQLYMSARLAARGTIADELYARGAGLKLVRILAGYDDDAATAAALLVTSEAGEKTTTDLAPLIRTLLRRVDREDQELQVLRGTIASIRFHQGRASIELALADGDRRIVAADGAVGPFSAGDEVRAFVRRDSTRAAAGWRLVGMGHAKADGWQLLAVSGLPGQAGPAYGALMHR
ncbi:hypothetical protein L6R52_00555 [Myxococcota bacterium]|nr:hypothetical protein [Myxococcota bacterium]